VACPHHQTRFTPSPSFNEIQNHGSYNKVLSIFIYTFKVREERERERRERRDRGRKGNRGRERTEERDKREEEKRK
jgi:hypothetical protein